MCVAICILQLVHAIGIDVAGSTTDRCKRLINPPAYSRTILMPQAQVVMKCTN